MAFSIQVIVGIFRCCCCCCRELINRQGFTWCWLEWWWNAGHPLTVAKSNKHHTDTQTNTITPVPDRNVQQIPSKPSPTLLSHHNNIFPILWYVKINTLFTIYPGIWHKRNSLALISLIMRMYIRKMSFATSFMKKLKDGHSILLDQPKQYI